MRTIKFEDLVNKYNVVLADAGKGYRLQYEEYCIQSEEYCIQSDLLISFTIILANSNGIKYSNVYLCDEDFDELIEWFKDKGVNLGCNNTRQTFWEREAEEN